METNFIRIGRGRVSVTCFLDFTNNSKNYQIENLVWNNSSLPFFFSIVLCARIYLS